MEKKKPEQVDQIGENVQIDEAVINNLPQNCRVLSVMPSGHSRWVPTVKIVVQLQDGKTAELFKKGAATRAGGEGMVKDTYFYLCEFVEMNDALPSPRNWAAAVSTAHLNSMGKSPTGQFGFHVPTYLGNVPVDNIWNSSWSAFWAQQMKSLFDQDERAHETDQELECLEPNFLEKTIPRYLGPLESEGRSIRPCLIHSDLWPGNIKPRTSSGEPCMFDSCAYWGHNEADLAVCRNPRYKLGPPSIREYLERVPISEPKADFDSKNAVYAMKFHALLSVMYSKEGRYRQILKGELKALMGKLEARSAEPAEQRGHGL